MGNFRVKLQAIATVAMLWSIGVASLACAGASDEDQPWYLRKKPWFVRAGIYPEDPKQWGPEFAAEGKPTGPAAAPSWLATVSSSYSSPEGPRTLSGSGVIVRVGNKFFVLCDSHLSQGDQSFELRIGGKPILVKGSGRLADNQRDLELLEIPDPGIRPVFEYQNGGFTLTRAPGSKADPDFNFLYVGRNLITSVARDLRETPTGWIPWQESSEQNYLDPGSPEQMLLPRQFGLIPKNAAGTSYVSDNGVVAGMSGGPLLEPLANAAMIFGGSLNWSEGYRLKGLTKGYDRYFNRSYFSTESQIADLVTRYFGGEESLEKYLAAAKEQSDAVAPEGPRGLVGKARWKYGKIPYRDYGNGTLEINPIQQLSGGGSSGDGGGGSSGDGGGSRSPSRSAGTESWFRKLGLKPGMQINSASILGFEGKGTGQAYYANPESLEWSERIPDAQRKLLPVGMDLLPLLQRRLEAAKTLKPRAKSTDCWIDEKALSEKSLIRIRLPYDPTNPTSMPLYLELDRQGRLVGSASTEFDPILQFIPGTQKKYVVDVRGLFFADLSTARKGGASEKALPLPSIVLWTGKFHLDTPFDCLPTDRPDLFDQAKRLNPPKSAASGDCDSATSPGPRPVPDLAPVLREAL